MKNFNYNEIVSQDEMLKLKSVKDRLNTFTDIESKKLETGLFQLSSNKIKINEILNTGFYNNFPDDQKKLMAAQLMYNSDKIIKILLSVGIDYDTLNLLCKRITELKNYRHKNINQNYINIILSVTNKLCLLVNKILKTDDEDILLNKFMYITTFEEILYKNIEYQKIKK